MRVRLLAGLIAAPVAAPVAGPVAALVAGLVAGLVACGPPPAPRGVSPPPAVPAAGAPDAGTSAAPPSVPAAPIAKTFDDEAAALGALAPKISLLVAELDGTTCTPLHAVHETDELAIGPASAVYVLLALADQVMRGKLTWDHDLANRMISNGDEGATDHLIHAIGRKSVEAALHTAHHAQPLLDVPFLGAREMRVLETEVSAEEIAKYLALKASPRRAYLDGPFAQRPPAPGGAADWKTGLHVPDLGWFASTLDLCNAMIALEDRATHVPDVRDVLAITPGLALDRKTWTYVGFARGAEPGVLAGAWLLHRDDDKRFVVSIIANDANGPAPDEPRAFAIAGAVIEMLAREAR